MRFLITDLGEDEIVLGYPWLAAFQPCIDWKNTMLDEEEQPLVIRTLDPSLDKEVARIRKAWIHVTIGPPHFLFTLFSVSLLVTCHVITSCDYFYDLLFCHVHCL